MGIADFGVSGTGAGSTAYSYSTSTLQGSAQVRALRMAASSGSTLIPAAFELNAVLVFQEGGKNYSYWIQNGLHLDTSTDEYTIGGAYVWNFSSPSAHLSSSELRGNASSVLVSDTYYFIPGCGVFPGQCSTVSLPANLTARIAVSACGIYPCVDYEYDIGGGWVTYDTVAFLHLANATTIGFLVDGHQYTPLGTGTFYDAEWDCVAAGGGSSGRDVASDLQMALDFWNGHNYQAVPTAWNFGGDTGESSFNITDALNSSGPGGVPGANLTSGPGTLGVLYNGSSAGFLNVTAPVLSPAELEIDGAPVPFQNGSANLTLAAGTYSLSLQDFANASERVTVQPGQSTPVNLSGAGRTTFKESGLTPGTEWGVTVDGFTHSGPGPLFTFNLPNGTYPIAYSKVPGFYRNSTDPSNLTIPARTPIQVDWTPFTYPVPVSETGLPQGTAWWVNMSGMLVQGNSTTLVGSAPNGSTEYSVGSAYEFVASPAEGTIDVTAGATSPIDVQFSYRFTYIAGTVSPSDAAVTIGGLAQTVSEGKFNDSVIPGAYNVSASAPGYVTQTMQVYATPGNTTVEQISLSPNSSASITPSSPSSGGIPAIDVVVGVGVVAVAAVAIVSIALLRRRTGPK
jgi:Thermopsin